MEVRDAFVASLGFEPDPFQLKAMDALDAGRSVLVAAPTGSGKTVVAEYAVAQALASQAKAFYTTPLKALSNQKYGDLVKRHGAEHVGLLTGDNAINGDAPIVVMTTEVLRNMVYAGSGALAGLRYVVLDEVHYLQNPYRGPVWEEVIIHLPRSVGLVCLSATVSNAEEVADWLGTVRGAAEVVIEERRPIELQHLYMVGDRAGGDPLLLPTFVDGRPNPEAAALDAAQLRDGPRRQAGPRRTRQVTPRRADVVERLDDEAMLPAIVFIFSRKACEEAVASCLRDGVRLTSPEERREIRRIAEAHVEHLSDADLRVLRYGEWLTGLEAGLAAHHAGMVPPFKEAVEHCFALGLAKVVFATETLSLGINMPARSVVIEKLTKFTGERHEPLTPGEYTQLTGRAGRRGIDELGYAVVLWSPFVPFDQVAGLAGTRTYALSSSFRPTFNMACNLVRRYPPDQAHHLLNLSFAQYRVDSDVVRLEAHLERARQALVHVRAEASCELGDVEEYRALLRSAEEATRHRPSDRQEVQHALEKVKPGDVLVLPGGARGVVVSAARRKGGEVRLGVLTGERRKLLMASRDFPAPPRHVGRVELPRPYLPDDKAFRARAVEALARIEVVPVTRHATGVAGGRRGSSKAKGAEAMARAERAASHPVASCPDLRRHLKAAERAERLGREADRMETKVKGQVESLARQFDRVLRVLEAWGYVDGWSLTEQGARLARIYHEADLLVAEAVQARLLDGLDAPSVAALASCFTYETRGQEAPVGWMPTAQLKGRWAALQELARNLVDAEDDAGLPHTRLPDPGFAAMAHAWASGKELERVLEDEGLSGGDFVRNVKQLIDLLRQLGDVAPVPATAAACRAAAEALFRGVVAASSVVTTDAPDT